MVLPKIISCIFITSVVLGKRNGALASRCSKNGPHQDPSRCDSFLVCAPFGPVLMHCPHGLHFNSEYSICDWPEHAGCKEKGSKIAGYNLEPHCPIYPHPEDCTKFYLCSPLGPIVMECPDNLFFNPDLSVCDWPHNTRCAETRITPHTNISASTTEAIDDLENIELTTTEFENSETTFMIETFETNNPLNDTFEHFTTNNDITYYFTLTNTPTTSETTNNNLDSFCESNIWPHPNDCTQFSMCSSNGTVNISCPENLHFNPVLLYCQWSHIAGCDTAFNMSGVDVDTDSKNTTTNLDDSETTQTVLSTLVLSDISSKTVSSETTESLESLYNYTDICKSYIWPHPDNCSTFFMCSSTGPIEIMCPDQLHFNPVLLICDWPYRARCITIIPDEQYFTTETTEVATSTLTTEEIEGTTTTFMSTETTFIGTTELPTNQCESAIWPHPNNCSKFLKCGSTGPVEMVCPDDHYFNPTLLVCDWSEKSGCNDGLHGLAEETTRDLLKETFTYTNLDSFTESTTNARDSDKLTTMYPCRDRKKICRGSIWPHPNNCSKFFMCSSTGPVEVWCPEQYLFNPILLVCDWSYNIGCGEFLHVLLENNTLKVPDEYITEEGPSEEFNFNDNESTSTATEEFQETSTIEPTGTTEYPKIPGTADSSSEDDNSTGYVTSMEIDKNNKKLCEASIWPHPNCSKFYMCGSTGAVELKCPGPLHFSAKWLVCDWPNLAECQQNSYKKYNAETNGTTVRELTKSGSNVLKADDLAYNLIPEKLDSSETITAQPQMCDEGAGSTIDNELFCKAHIWPHLDDCTKFYMCDFGGTTELQCPEGLHFHPVWLVCYQSESDKCPEHIIRRTKRITSHTSIEFVTENMLKNRNTFTKFPGDFSWFRRMKNSIQQH